MNVSFSRVAGRGVLGAMALAAGLVLASGCGSTEGGEYVDDDNCSMISLHVPDSAPANGIVGEPYATGWKSDTSTFEVDSPPPGLDARLQGTPTEEGTFEMNVHFSNECESRDVAWSVTIEDIPPQCDDDDDCAILSTPFGEVTECDDDDDCITDETCVVVTKTLNVCVAADRQNLCGQCLRDLDVSPVDGSIPLTLCVVDEGQQQTCNMAVYGCSEARHCIEK